MSNVGYGTLTVIPSAKGFASALSGQVDAPIAASSEKTSKSFGNAFTGAVGSITKVTGAAVGLVAGLVGGLAIKGGIARQLDIENATAKLTGLGNSTEAVKSIMDNALASVKGTAFGMGDAATVAAGAVAAGIKPGQDLTRVLKLTADAATIAGTDMGSMGSIFNKVAASGKLQGDVVQQLQDAGIPILQMVAKQYGVTAAEASKMVSAGQVDFAHFADAMESGLGGAALKSGDTTLGALANMKAAFSRFGVALTSGFFPLFKGVFGGVQDIMDAVTAKLTPFATAFGDKFGKIATPAVANFSANVLAAFGKLGDFIAGFMAKVTPAVSGFKDGLDNMALSLGPIIGGLLGALGPLLQKLPVVGKMFVGITGPVGLVVGLFAALMASSPALRDALGGAFSTVIQLLGDVVAAVAPVAATLSGVFGSLLTLIGNSLAPVITQLAGILTGVLGAAMPTITELFFTFANVISALVPVVAQVLAAIMPLVSTILAQLAPVLTQLITSLLPPLSDLFGQIVDAVLPVVSALADALMPVIQALLPVVVVVFGVVSDVITALMPVVTVVFNTIVAVIQAAMTVVQGIIDVVTGIISGNWGQVWTGIKEIFSGVWDLIVSIVTGAIALVGSIITGALNVIGSVWSGAWSAIWSFLTGIFGKIVSSTGDAIGNVLNFFSGLQTKLLLALAGASSWLANIGKNIVDGLWNGLKKAWNGMLGLFKGLVNLLPDSIKKILGIHSPSRVFMQIGQYTGEGMALGIESTAGRIADASESLIPTSPSIASPNVANGGVAGALASAAAGGGDHWTIEYNDHSTSNEDKQAKLLKAEIVLKQTVAARRKR